MPCSVASAALDLFLDLAALPTPPGAERAAADRCLEYLRELGLEPIEDDAAARIDGDTGNVYVRVEPTAAGTPIFLCAHLDTVPPTGPIEPIVAHGMVSNVHDTILGADNKASVAGMLDGLRRILADGLPQAGIEIVLTPQEEVGLRGAKAFDTDRLRARHGFVYDHAGPLGGIVVAAPGQTSLTLDFTGRAAHSGIAPEQGASAIAAAAHAIAGMRLGRIDDETTANVGLIAGGIAGNIIPPTCRLEAEVRSRDPQREAEEVAHLLAAAASGATVAGCSVETRARTEYVAYRHPRTGLAVRLARSAIEAAGYPVREQRVGGGADAHVFIAAGLQCVTLTSGMELIHTADERISVADVDGLSNLTVELVQAAVGG